MSLFLFFYSFFILIFVFLSVAFYTLLERKILSYHQNRKGPYFVSLMGLLQPFPDALKMMSKTEFILLNSNIALYWVFPMLSFFLMVMVWLFFYSIIGNSENYLSCLIFLCVISVSSYGLIFSGWSSNSKYSLLGSLRGVAQSISYELLLFLCFFFFFFFLKTYSFLFFYSGGIVFFFFVVYISLFLSLVCEVNRSPFDLSEGESELVSGFNIEYGGLKFALIFLSEYGLMIFMCFILSLMLKLNFFFLMMFVLIYMIFMLWFRSSFPRVRFDVLMYLVWKYMSILVLLFFIFYLLIL